MPWVGHVIFKVMDMQSQQAAPCFTVLHVGCGVKSDSKLPEACMGPPWREIRPDIHPETQPAPFMDIVALAIKST